MNNELEVFGKELMSKLRDVALECAEGLCENRFKSPGHQAYQKKLLVLSDEQKELFVETLGYCLDGGINDFLYAMNRTGMKFSTDGKTVCEWPDEKQIRSTIKSWREKYSKYPDFFI